MVTAKAEVSGFSTATDAETGQLAQLKGCLSLLFHVI